MATPPAPETQLAALYGGIARRMVTMFREVERRGAEGSAAFIAAQARQLALDLDQLDADSAAWLRSQIPEQYARSAGQAQLTLNRAGVPIAEAGFTGFDTRAIVALEGRLSGDLARVREAIGTGLALGGPPRDTARAIAAGLEQDGQVQMRNGMPRVQVPSGKFWDVEAYSKMLGRTVVADTRRVAFRERYLSNGIDLVVVVANGTRHPTCAAWEGVTLSLTGSTPGFPTVNDARAGGLFHPQCRHRYVVDTSQPQPEIPTGRVDVPEPEAPLPTLGLQPRTAAPSIRVRGPGRGGLPPASQSFNPGAAFDSPEVEQFVRGSRPIDRRQDLTSQERAGVVAYKGADFIPVNSALRDPSQVQRGRGLRAQLGSGPARVAGGTIGAVVDQLDQAISKSPLAQDLTLYRGVKGTKAGRAARFNDFKLGTEFSDSGYSSWTADRVTGVGFARQNGDRGILMRVQAPAGSRALFVDEVESEFLLARNTRYRIVAVEENVVVAARSASQVLGDAEQRNTVVTVEVVN